MKTNHVATAQGALRRALATSLVCASLPATALAADFQALIDGEAGDVDGFPTSFVERTFASWGDEDYARPEDPAAAPRDETPGGGSFSSLARGGGAVSAERQYSPSWVDSDSAAYVAVRRTLEREDSRLYAEFVHRNWRERGGGIFSRGGYYLGDWFAGDCVYCRSKPVCAVPEPDAAALTLGGLLAIAAAIRRRRATSPCT